MGKPVIYRTTSVKKLSGITSRMLLALARADVTTVGDLVDMDWSDVKAIQNIGEVTANKLERIVSQYDVRAYKKDVQAAQEIDALRGAVTGLSRQLDELDERITKTNGRVSTVEMQNKSTENKIRRLFADGNNYSDRIRRAHTRVDKLDERLTEHTARPHGAYLLDELGPGDHDPAEGLKTLHKLIDEVRTDGKLPWHPCAKELMKVADAVFEASKHQTTYTLNELGMQRLISGARTIVAELHSRDDTLGRVRGELRDKVGVEEDLRTKLDEERRISTALRAELASLRTKVSKALG